MTRPEGRSGHNYHAIAAVHGFLAIAWQCMLVACIHRPIAIVVTNCLMAARHRFCKGTSFLGHALARSPGRATIRDILSTLIEDDDGLD